MNLSNLNMARPVISKLAPGILHRVYGVIFNLTGTLIDHGGQAPMTAIKSGFLAYGIYVPRHIIREFAGQTMCNQVKLICENTTVREQWDTINNRPFKKSDINMITNKAYWELAENIKTHAQLIDGAAALTQALKDSNVKIGITSEYGYHMTHSILPCLISQGLEYDNIVCIDQHEQPTETILATWFDKSTGYIKNREYLKIGSTDLDIWEGLVTGIHTCNMVDSSQQMGLTKQQLNKIIPEKYNFKASEIIKRWERINCNYHAKTVGDIVASLEHY